MFLLNKLKFASVQCLDQQLSDRKYLKPCSKQSRMSPRLEIDNGAGEYEMQTIGNWTVVVTVGRPIRKLKICTNFGSNEDHNFCLTSVALPLHRKRPEHYLFQDLRQHNPPSVFYFLTIYFQHNLSMETFKERKLVGPFIFCVRFKGFNFLGF